jgi:serine O-acetyltransferase
MSDDHSWNEVHLPEVVTRLLASYGDGVGLNRKRGEHLELPDRQMVFQCLDRLFAIVFPGLLDTHPVTPANLRYHIGDLLNHIHMDLRVEVMRALHYDCRVRECLDCDVEGRAEAAVTRLLEALPDVRGTLKEDVQAAFDGDPAARSHDDVILSYPCVEAIGTYRFAHELYLADVPLIPRMWSERAHSRTGIDINPGARIGPRFFIDHGTGVVIGETTEIGRNVALYQGVTLGARAPGKGQSLRGEKRHPTIEDDVVIYAGATILGGETVIGRGSVIGGNVWLTKSVPPGSLVTLGSSDVVVLDRSGADARPAAAARAADAGA